jgi:hypothetical protein
MLTQIIAVVQQRIDVLRGEEDEDATAAFKPGLP